MPLAHEIAGNHLIDGAWVGSKGGSDPAFTAVSPTTGEPLAPPFCEADDAEVGLALRAATSAMDACLDLPPRWPAALLDGIAAAVMDLGDGLLERAEAETALPRGRLTGERARTVAQLKMFARQVREGSWVDATIDTADPTRSPTPKPDIRRMLRPRGPVAVFGASNFPFAFSTAGGDTASALAAGCPVIVKCHPSHPGTSELFAAAILAALHETALPLGLFALLQGRSHELSGLLVRHPAVAAVGFTGSLKAGRALFDLAAARPSPIPVYAEMGSINPVVIMYEAMMERGPDIAKGLAASLLLGGGQFCTKPGVIFAVFDEDLTRSLSAMLPGALSAQTPVTMLNGPLRDSFAQRAKQIAKADGVKTLIAPEASGHASISPALLETTGSAFLRDEGLREEAFGPLGLVVYCRDVDETVACLRTIGGSLTGTLHAGMLEDPADVKRVMSALESRRPLAMSGPRSIMASYMITTGLMLPISA